MTAKTDPSRLWRLLALLLAMVLGALVALTLSERRSALEERPTESVIAEPKEVAAPEANSPVPSRPAPDVDPFGFDWDPFGEDWERLFPDHWRLGGRAGIDPDHPVQREFDRIREEMREEMRRQREAFRGRMAIPDPIPPRRPSPPVAPEGSPRSPERAGPDGAAQTPAFDVSRLSLPGAVVLLVKVTDLVEGSFAITLGEGQVTVSADRRAPDGVTRRLARTVPLSESIDPEGVEVRRVEGGYRVVFPVR